MNLTHTKTHGAHGAMPPATMSHLHRRRQSPIKTGLHQPVDTLYARRLEAQRTTAPTEDYPKYDGAELRAHTRPGAEDFLQWPSRIGGWLYYRGGKRVPA